MIQFHSKIHCPYNIKIIKMILENLKEGVSVHMYIKFLGNILQQKVFYTPMNTFGSLNVNKILYYYSLHQSVSLSTIVTC
jgi:hypothetical protein